MNLIDALKTGRHIRVDANYAWWEVDSGSRFSRSDVLCDTWEVEDVPITLTRKKYWDAVATYLKKSRSVFVTPVFTDLAKELGLG